MQRRQMLQCFVAMAVLLTLVPHHPISARQTSKLSLSVAVFPGLEPLVEPIIQRFEQANPNIQVEVRLWERSMELAGYGSKIADDYFAQWARLAGTADVLMVPSNTLGPEAARAGFVLDLKGLINADPTLNERDYQPQAWQAFQWDGGFWALPMSYDTVSFLYSPDAFNAAGIAPPNAAWTLEDLSAAARALTVKKDGKSARAGLFAADMFLPPLFAALAGEGFSDNTSIPVKPRLTSPTLDRLVQAWSQLEAEGIATRMMSDPSGFPLQVGVSSMLRANMGTDKDALAGALLPGGKAALFAYGFAVSGGTVYPDQAYQLAKFLTTDPDIAEVAPMSFAAKISLQTPDSGDNTGHRLSKENRAFVAEAVEKVIPSADLLFGNYLTIALAPGSGVAEAQQQASTVLKTAADKRQTVQIVVPGPPGSAPAGKVTLKFGVYDGSVALVHAKEWADLVKAFTKSDTQVGQIKLDHLAPTTSDWGKRVQAMPQTEDCFYNRYARLADYKTSGLLALNPLIDADPGLMREAVVGLAAFDADHKIYGLPLGIEVVALRYDKDQFDKTGVPLPTEGWTIDQFLDALKQIRAQSPDQPAFYAPMRQADYLLMLVVAQGILPIDPRTQPPTINFSDAKTVAAIRQMADLAKNGSIYYRRSAAFIFNIAQPKGTPAITVVNENIGSTSVSQLTTFPTGAEFIPISYTPSAAFIGAQTAYPEACYRWLRLLAQHPEVYDQMPADQTLVDDPRVAMQWTPDVIATYKRQYALLASPKAIVLSSLSDPLVKLWLARALDRYILENADLERELSSAEQFTKDYITCMNDLPANVSVPPGGILTDCAFKVDPTVEASFK